MVSTKQQHHQLIFVVVVLAAAVATVSTSTFKKGTRQPRDGLVCSGDVNIRAQYGRVVSAQKICNVPRWNQTITQIVAFDMGRPGKGGYVQINRGGLGQKNVTLYLWSQKSQPLNFTIEVYAKPYW